MAKVLIGLGSNLGNRSTWINQACQSLETHPDIICLQRSSLYETEPESVKPLDSGEAAPWFINAVLLLETSLMPRELLQVCMSVEKELGRKRSGIRISPNKLYESRTIDIDLLFYDDLIIDEPDLVLPHPRLHERQFVLKPLAEILPTWQHPVLGKQIVELLARFELIYA
jgi:2-amino-4-hydroxy-6-hydroxymethyldihydropteridine diphosphokinase